MSTASQTTARSRNGKAQGAQAPRDFKAEYQAILKSRTITAVLSNKKLLDDAIAGILGEIDIIDRQHRREVRAHGLNGGLPDLEHYLFGKFAWKLDDKLKTRLVREDYLEEVRYPNGTEEDEDDDDC